MSLPRLGAVTLANVKMLVRDRGALFFSLAFPLLFMVIFGLIFGNGDQSRVDLGVVGRGPLVAALAEAPTIDVRRRPDEPTAVERVRDGKDTAAVVVQGGEATLYYSNVLATQAAMVRGLVAGITDAVNLRAAGAEPVVRLETTSVESSRLRYIDFLVPGLIAMALSQSAVFGVAGALVSFRERGIFRRLRVTPLPLREFAFGRLTSHLLLALAQTAVLLLVGRVAFGVRLNADPAALAALVLLGALCFVVVGFFVGAVARSQEAAAALGNVITLPMVFLAGVFFPLDTAPGWLQSVAKVLPLTYLADGLRDVAIRGHGLGSTLVDLAVLGGVTLGVAALSLRVFRWEAA